MNSMPAIFKVELASSLLDRSMMEKNAGRRRSPALADVRKTQVTDLFTKYHFHFA
jgi:hypothetical protein